jgi:hypothetical protein
MASKSEQIARLTNSVEVLAAMRTAALQKRSESEPETVAAILTALDTDPTGAPVKGAAVTFGDAYAGTPLSGITGVVEYVGASPAWQAEIEGGGGKFAVRVTLPIKVGPHNHVLVPASHLDGFAAVIEAAPAPAPVKRTRAKRTAA